MAVETVRIRPEIDPAALKKTEDQLEKAFSPSGRALSGLKKDTAAFWREAQKAADAFKREKSGPKDWQKAVADSAKSARTMRDQLQATTATLGKDHRLVREMRMEYERVSREAKKTADEAARAGKERLRDRLGGAARSVGRGVALGLGNQIAAMGTDLIGRVIGAPGQIRAEMDKAAKSANLTAEEFSALKHAAELSGASIETVDKATRKLTGILSKKQPPEVQEAMAKLGLSTERLRGLRPQEQLGEIGDALQRIQDPAERSTMAARLLGEEFGPSLIPLLEAGSQGIRAMTDDARSLGLVFDNDAAAAAERLGDAQDRLGKAVQGTLIQAYQALVPLLADVAEGVVEFVRSNREVISGKITAALTAIVEKARDLGRWLSEVDWGKVGEYASQFASTLGTVTSMIAGLVESLGPANAALALMGLKIAAMLGPYGLLAAAAVAAGAAIAKAFSTANDHLETTIERVRKVRIEALDESIGGLQEEERSAEERYARADRIEKRMLDAAQEIHGGEVPEPVKKQIAVLKARARYEGSTPAELEQVKVTLKTLETAAANKRRADAKKAFRPKGPPKGPPPEKPREVSSAQAAIDRDIDELAKRAGEREYQRVLQGGGSTMAADEAAKKTQETARQRLQAQSADLARKGFIGQAGGPSFLGGPQTTAGGAVPISLDLGGRGGPAPVQIVNLNVGGVDVSLQGTFTQAPEDIARALRGPVREELERAVAESLPLIDSTIRR